MLFRTIFALLRLKLINILINRALKSRLIKPKNAKTATLVSYGLELFASYLLRSKKK